MDRLQFLRNKKNKESIHIYEVRDGEEVIARYTSRTPAVRKRRELKKIGIRTKVYSLFVPKYIPLEEKPIRKSMRYWHGPIPWQIAPEGASQLRVGWEHINDVFYIGSYRNGEVCQPYDRTEDLSIQPNGNELSLCFHSIGDDMTYILLDGLEWVSVRPTRVEFSGRSENGERMMFTMEIADDVGRNKLTVIPFRKGWYRLKSGILMFVDEEDERMTKEQHSDRLVGMYPIIIVYPAFGMGDFAVGTGHMAIHDGESLDDFVRQYLRTDVMEYINTDNAKELATAFRRRSDRTIRGLIERGRGTEPFRDLVMGEC